MRIYINEIRDLSRYQDLPFSEVISSFSDKLSPHLRDNVTIRQGTNYIELDRFSDKQHQVSQIQFKMNGDVLLYPNITKTTRIRLGHFTPPLEDYLTDRDLDYLVDRILNMKYLPRTFLKSGGNYD